MLNSGLDESIEDAVPRSVAPSAPPEADYQRFLSGFHDLQVIDGPTWSGVRPRVPSEEFRAKYAGKSAADLEMARDEVKSRFDLASSSGLRARYEAGEYEIRVIDPARPFHTGPTRTGEPITRVRRNAGSSEVHIITLPFDEYADVYALSDEFMWLLAQGGHGN